MTEEKKSQVKLTVPADNEHNNFSSSNMNMQLSGEKRNDMPMEKLFQDQKLLLQQPECTGVSLQCFVCLNSTTIKQCQL